MKLSEFVINNNNILVYPQMGAIGLALSGYKLREIYDDPKKQLEIALKMDQNFQMDFSYPIDYGSVFLKSLKVAQREEDFDFPQTLENPIKTKEDLDKLREINIYENKDLKLYLQSIELISKNIDKPNFVAVVGPFTLAMELMGPIDILKNTIKNKELVNELLDYCTDIIESFVEELIKKGVGIIQISEPSSVVLSPKMFKEFILHRLERINKKITVFKTIHICGNIKHILDDVIKCGCEGISFDQIMDMSKIAQSIPEDIVLIGNIDPIRTMAESSEEEINLEVIKLLDSMKPYKNFMVSFGCDCLIKTPITNIKKVVEVTHQYKK